MRAQRIGQADLAIVEEAGEVVPAPGHVVHRLQDVGGSAGGFRARATTRRACPREAACFFVCAARGRKSRGKDRAASDLIKCVCEQHICDSDVAQSAHANDTYQAQLLRHLSKRLGTDRASSDSEVSARSGASAEILPRVSSTDVGNSTSQLRHRRHVPAAGHRTLCARDVEQGCARNILRARGGSRKKLGRSKAAISSAKLFRKFRRRIKSSDREFNPLPPSPLGHQHSPMVL